MLLRSPTVGSALAVGETAAASQPSAAFVPLRRTLRETAEVLRAKADLLTERSPMPAPITNLSEKLKAAKASLARAPAVAQKLMGNVGDLDAALQQVDQFSAEVAQNTAEVRSLLGAMTNGAPVEPKAGDA